MQTFKYVGDDPVDLPTLGLAAVESGQVVEVDDSTAAGMTGSASWERVTKTTKNTKNEES